MTFTTERQAYNEAFDAAFNQLNEQQKGAVQALDGPVMALAGPGTGKTQLLAIRIGHILRQTDATANEVLALTFTDAGSFAMRQRLRQFIGPEANRVTIATFHSFCSQVIAEHSDYFSQLRELELVSDLEVVDILRTIIKQAPIDSPIRRLKGNPYQYLARIKELFGTMKREQWTLSDMEAAVQSMAERARQQLVAKRKVNSRIWPGVTYQKGDVREDKVQQEVEKMEGLLAAASQLDRYNELLDQRGRYDYNDLINWVLRAFEENEMLLAEYQERYQYFLVDEYQDTNRSQNKLVELLVSFWDKPNLFVVGDDDQSIYRFQGAEMANIRAFITKYQPEVHVLVQNYRSNQSILDHASRLIAYNDQSRIATKLNIPKELIASHPDKKNLPPDQSTVTVHVYANKTQEEAGVISAIERLHNNGVPYGKMAVLYSKHALAHDMIRYLTQKGVPIHVKKRVNVLQEMDVRRLLTILQYLQAEYKAIHSGQHLLFELLHFDFFGFSARDIGLISVHCRHRHKAEEDPDHGEPQEQVYWRDVLNDPEAMEELGVSTPHAFAAVAKQIEQWIQDLSNYTLQVLFEKVMTESKLLYKILSSGESAWRLQVVNTLFDFIKNETAKNPTLSLEQLLAMIDSMEEEKIALEVMKVRSAQDAVNFMTVHGSKGLEFDHVFLIGCTENNWEKRRGNSFTYSYPQRKFPEDDEAEKTVEKQELRRLFFVALTRAADRCYISFAAKNDKEKDLMPTQFIAEVGISTDGLSHTNVPAAQVEDYQSELLRYQEAQPQLIDHDLIDRVLANFKMSSTSLNKYLRCPTTFYFENILRVPSARTTYIGYGNAIHFALEMYNKKLDREGMKDPGLGFLLDQYYRGIEKYKSHFTALEFDNIRQHGTDSLTNYYEQYHHHWTAPRSVKGEYKIPHTEHAGVPISGTIDRLDIYDDHIAMTDYKTGNPSNASSKLKAPKDEDDLGGEYWRQIIFYYLLLKGEGKFTTRIDKGHMSFVDQKTDGKYLHRTYPMEHDHIKQVSDQLVQAYDDIINHKFEKGCKDSDCKWCSFVASNRAEVLLQSPQQEVDESRQHFEL